MPAPRFRSDGDACLSIFRDIYAIGALAFPQGAKVLEIGCAEADWMTPMLEQRPDLQITGIDWRSCVRPGLAIQGDVLAIDFVPHTFDVIVGISSIEHIGLGHYSQDPIDVDGDRHCMDRVVRWLKPGGWFYADVPYAEAYHVDGTSHRIYDDAALRARLLVPGLVERRRWYTTGDASGVHEAPRPAPGLMQYVGLYAVKES